MTGWTHRTQTGRVVYDRPVHHFTVRDAVRVVKKILYEDNPKIRGDVNQEFQAEWLELAFTVFWSLGFYYRININEGLLRAVLSLMVSDNKWLTAFLFIQNSIRE